jgi:hypothetical protein
MEQVGGGKNHQWQLMNRKVRQIIYPDNFAKTMEQLRNNIVSRKGYIIKVEYFLQRLLNGFCYADGTFCII